MRDNEPGTDKAYGIHPMFANVAIRETPPPKPIIPVADRVVTAEATVLGFIAENSLSYTLAPRLIELAKTLANDRKALNGLNMDRTTASYKMRFSVGQTCDEELIRENKFSLNIDESTSSNLHRVLCVLVSYYCPVQKLVVVKHFTSISVIQATSEALFNELVTIIEGNQIPWTNLMSVLMDSCSVMRGSKSGVEVRLRKKANHLLDIDGDSCHHAHNACRVFCKPFEN